MNKARTGIIDEDVNAAERVQRGLDHALAILHRIVVSDRFASSRANLLHHCVSRRRTLAAALDVAAKIVH